MPRDDESDTNWMGLGIGGGLLIVVALALSIWALVRSYDEKTVTTVVTTPSIGTTSNPDMSVDPLEIVWAPGAPASEMAKIVQLKSTWAEVYALRLTVAQVPVRIILSNQYSSAATTVQDFIIPANTAEYVLRDTEFFAPLFNKAIVSNAYDNFFRLRVSPGVKMSGLRGIDGPIHLIYEETTTANGACMTMDPTEGDTNISNRRNTFYIRNFARVQATHADCPFIRVQASVTTGSPAVRPAVIYLENYGRLMGNATIGAAHIGSSGAQSASNQLILEVGTMGSYDIGCVRTHATATAAAGGLLTIILTGQTRVQGDANWPALIPFPLRSAIDFPQLNTTIIPAANILMINRMPAPICLVSAGANLGASSVTIGLLGGTWTQTLAAAGTGAAVLANIGFKNGDLVKLDATVAVGVFVTTVFIL
jgi:hypothetical protein